MDRTCVCGHSEFSHGVRCGTRLPSGWIDVSDYPGACSCPGFEDAAAPKPGERIEFGLHRMPAKDAETAPAWPSMARFAASMRQRTLRRSK